MRFAGRGTVRDFLWNFARAEFEIPPSGPRHTQPEIAAELRGRILRGERESLSPTDWRRLHEAVVSTRSTIVNPVIALVREWFLGEITPSDLADLRVMNLRIFTSMVPSRRLVDFAKALDRGVFPRIWDPKHYRELRAHFDISRMHGAPILVGERPTGPFTVIEGTTRLSVATSMRDLGELGWATLPVVAGVGAGIAGWEWY